MSMAPFTEQTATRPSTPAAAPDAAAPPRAAGRAGAKVRVLAFPKDRFRATQPFHALLAESLEAEGLEVDEYSPKRCLSGRYDVVHLHHPEKFVSQRLTLRDAVRFAVFFLTLWVQRLRGARVVWTAHNEGPHEPGHPLLEKLYWRLFLPMVDGVIHLSQSARAIVEARWPRLKARPAFVIPHGDFRGAYAAGLTREEARRRLGYGEGERVLAFVGNVRAYKNVPELARAFAALPDPDLRLLIAGRVHTDALKREIEAAADPRIRLIDAFVDEADMQLYLGAADLVVLPFRRILNSGSAILALSFDRPVLVPDLGSLRELQQAVGGDWVHIYRGEMGPEVLAEALGGFLAHPRGPTAPLEALSWPAIGRSTAEAYRRVLGRGK
ncbi:MAG TPA: glycosyltransferase [Azospirillaceae bacterium]|nr:glycosyltransferase [Azospirillaceae bacterium]